MSVALQDLRGSLPAGPSAQRSALDRIVDQLTTATNSNSLRAQLADWGWTDESGRSLNWRHWQAQPRYSIIERGRLSYTPHLRDHW
jgi:hypothetical protein